MRPAIKRSCLKAGGHGGNTRGYDSSKLVKMCTLCGCGANNETPSQLPKTPEDWLEEIRLAIADASGGDSIDRLIREPDRAVNLFHLAPLVCLKFRGLDYRDEDLRTRVTKGALANYVANSDPGGIDHGLAQRPLLAFAICYLTAHYVLDLIDEAETESILNYCDEHLD